MTRINTRRGIGSGGLAILLSIALLAFTVQPAPAATEMHYASGWTSTTPVQWTPQPPSPNPTGPSEGVTMCVGASSQPGGATAFFTFPTFSIPGTDVIDGVEVTVDYVTAGVQIIQLTSGFQSVTGTDKVLPINGGGTGCDGASDLTLGGPTDLWGATLTPADFNGGSIGVLIKQKIVPTGGGDPGSIPIDIDAIKLVVHHSSGLNAAPTAEANGPYSVLEGGSVSLSSAGSFDPDLDPLTIDWDLDNNGSFETPGASPTFSAVGFDGPDTQVVVVRVSDGSLDDTDTAVVNITNVAPTIQSITVDAASINEAQSVTVSGTFSDPGTGETYTGSSLWSDGASTAVSVMGNTFSTTRTFPDDHPATATASDPFTVDVTIADGDGGDDTATSPIVTVNNVATSISTIAASATSINEGDSVTVSGTFSDPAFGVVTEIFSGSAAWSDGPSGAVSVDGIAGTFTTSRTFADDHPSTGTPSDDFSVGVTIGDDDLGSDFANSPVITVNNVAPVLDPLVLSAAVIDEDGSVTVSGSFTDVGVLDTHSVSVDWGDGSSGPATVVQGAGAGTFSASHQYLDDDPTGTPSDNYLITVTVTDDDTGSHQLATFLTVENVEPVITDVTSSATFADKAEEGETLTISGVFTDVGTLDTHTVSVDWGDLSSSLATVTQGSGSGTFTADHAYVAGGVYSVTVSVTDDDTGLTTGMTLAVITGVGINGGVLQVVGTSGDDLVHVKRIQNEIDVFADFISPKHRRFDLAAVTSIEIWLCEGDDHANVHQSINLPATIHGGIGHDKLWGGSGPDVIDAGPGNDKLWGRGGDDELYGQEGNDEIWGGPGTDLLDGGPGNDKLNQ